ncbi:MAG: NUDIX hydrolase [Nitrososphaerota archaeon]|jgi:ADP-ribose pyrophosphatase YjhB (NUDIX family)|nr:hypothetical protein [Nitrososphaerota archaeon]MDG6932577.1 NUDIX hydrolase [Nitrososphaerota archaeon]MDG6935319.1 NUDIX hydrolase [Nitrososphaerota archaeon]
MPYALFGPSPKHFVPEGGFCISAFAIIERDGKVLLLRPRQHQRWEEWAPNWRIYDASSMSSEFSRWRFPSSYVAFGEHPDKTLERIMNGQLGIKNFSTPDGMKLYSFYAPSRRYPGEYHWDYCFLYKVITGEEPVGEEWIDELKYLKPSALKENDFGSAQGGLLEIVSDFIS